MNLQDKKLINIFLNYQNKHYLNFNFFEDDLSDLTSREAFKIFQNKYGSILIKDDVSYALEIGASMPHYCILITLENDKEDLVEFRMVVHDILKISVDCNIYMLKLQKSINKIETYDNTLTTITLFKRAVGSTEVSISSQIIFPAEFDDYYCFSNGKLL